MLSDARAANESPRTTKAYDRTSDAIGLDEIWRIRICVTAKSKIPKRAKIKLPTLGQVGPHSGIMAG